MEICLLFHQRVRFTCFGCLRMVFFVFYIGLTCFVELCVGMVCTLKLRRCCILVCFCARHVMYFWRTSNRSVYLAWHDNPYRSASCLGFRRHKHRMMGCGGCRAEASVSQRARRVHANTRRFTVSFPIVPSIAPRIARFPCGVHVGTGKLVAHLNTHTRSTREPESEALLSG